MAFQPETTTYEAGVLQWETTTPAQGGVGGVANAPLLQLANRTKYLKSHVDAIEAAAGSMAPINSPGFTGTPTVPNASIGDSSTKVANTKFVHDTVHSAATINCAGNANVAPSTAQLGCPVLVLVGILTGNISLIVPNVSGNWLVFNDTTGAFTVTVKTAAGAGVAVRQGQVQYVFCDTVDCRRTDCFAENMLAEFTGAGKRSLVTDGYQRLPGGLILQWGTPATTAVVNGWSTFSFPIAFPTGTLAFSAVNYHGSTASASSRSLVYTGLSASQFQLSWDVSGGGINVGARYIAIGY